MSFLAIPRPDKEINKMSMLWWIHIIQLDEEEGKIRHSCVWSTITLFMGPMMGHPGWGGRRLIKLNYMLMSVVSRGRWSIYLTQYPFPRTSFRSQSDRGPSQSQSPDSFISRGDRLPFSPPCSFDQWQAVYVVHLYHRRRRRNEFVSSVYSGTLVRRWGRGKNGQMNEWTNV